MHVTRRIEKMHAEKVGAKILRASLGELFERNAAGVRSDDGSRPAMLLDLFVQAAFDFEILDYRFDDQVAVFQFRQIVFEVSYGNQRSKIGSEEGGGFGFFRGFQSGAGDPAAILRSRFRSPP